ncbi:Endonuclease/exonuclease/phosphatase [Cinara cedri]|uniref:Endonuclease/exonuclease/phosphatase n=1 Tax=Cinara cedri TaxID=506608 RepID=A0A5E4N272_9HEMI|nr:Endonuclease/exonuclease/phosphatase [Cinara cedri]
MRTISGAIKSTPASWLPVLSNIASPHLRRYYSLVREYNNHALNRSLPIHKYIYNNPSQRLKSHKPPWKLAQKLINENYNLKSKWTEEWRLNNPDKFNLIEQPIEKVPGFQLPREEWVTLNRLRTGHGKTGNMLHKWELRDTPQCDCRHETQTANYIVEESNILPRDRIKESRLENWKSALRFGTWNIRTLYQPGAALTLVKEFNKHSQCDNCRQGGTGFIVKKNIASAIKDFKVVNSRLTILIVEGKFFNIAFVNAHAPSEDKSDEEKEEFYSLLESTLEGIPRHCIIILLGVFNAKIGKEEFFKTTTGSNSLHQLSNNNGFRLTELATERGLKIKSTSFPHKEIHKGTRRSPDGRYINQIDHVLVNTRFSNSVLDVRTFCDAECGSDHFLVVGKLKVKLKKAKKRKEEQTELFDIQKLCDLKICEDFCKNISNEFNNEHIDNENDDIESLWSAIRNVIRKATK